MGSTDKFSYRLGLDVGTSSLGWSVLRVDKKGKPCAIENAGSRIFSDGREPKSKSTLAATRRAARSARRRRDRFLQRQKFLLDELTKAGLFPKDRTERKNLQGLNPLELRTKALTKKLKPYEIGRALFHINQRRGFKSNRKDRSEERTSGKVANSARALLEEMGLIGKVLLQEGAKTPAQKEEQKKARQQEAQNRKLALDKLGKQKNLTYGSFLYQRQTESKSTRARPKTDDSKLYDIYPTREIYEDEFEKVWKAQVKHHPKLMSDTARKRIHQAIFHQRPLKPQELGQCVYMNKEKRTFRAMPSFQRYRICQEINNLTWETDSGRTQQRLIDYPGVQRILIEMMERPTNKNARIPFTKIKKEIKKQNLEEGEFTFNLEAQKRGWLDGNSTSNFMQHEDRIGRHWHDWPLEKQDQFIEIILSDQSDEEVCQRLMDEYGLSESVAEACVNAPLVDGTANISLKAARLMLKKMEEGKTDQDGNQVLLRQFEAAERVAAEEPDFVDPMRRPKTEESEFVPELELPYYGKAFEDGRHIIPGKRCDEDKGDDRKFYGGVTNPTVHVALNQIRQVVNELISIYGHPASIAIELGRDLPMGKEYRTGFERAQKRNQDRNIQLGEKLQEHGLPVTRDNLLRLQLWEEQQEQCPYSGNMIRFGDLFTHKIQVDHLIPFSRSLDDGKANKVVCTLKANQDKENRTPFEAFGDSPDGYDWDSISARAANITYEHEEFNSKTKRWEKTTRSKQWRFREGAQNLEGEEFLARQLNDTRYIGRLTREYLECICHIDKIDVLTGRLTYLLRRYWGLNSVLQEGVAANKKNRDDHRHHAVDAIVIGMTTKHMLQTVSTAANRGEELELDYLFEKRNGKSAIDPWDGFREDVKDVVQKITVSHKPQRKKLKSGMTDGALHNDTAYGIVDALDDDGQKTCTVKVRKPVESIKNKKHVESICSNTLRAEFQDAFEKNGEQGIKELACRKNIRRLRCKEQLSVIPIRDKSGNIYKGYKGDSNWGMEIYAFPPNHKQASKWEGIVISRFDAHKPDFQLGQTYKPHPAARLIMRLQINDCVEITKNGNTDILRLQRITPGTLTFAPIHEANVDARDRDKDDEFKFFYSTPNKLKSYKACKVHISPTGRVSRKQHYPSE